MISVMFRERSFKFPTATKWAVDESGRLYVSAGAECVATFNHAVWDSVMLGERGDQPPRVYANSASNAAATSTWSASGAPEYRTES